MIQIIAIWEIVNHNSFHSAAVYGKQKVDLLHDGIYLSFAYYKNRIIKPENIRY